MTSPQPAGFYSLELTEAAEQLITSLDYQNLFHLIYDLVFCTSTECVDRFTWQGARLTRWFDDEIESLPIAKKIALLRWLSDRLAFLHTVPVQEVAK